MKKITSMFIAVILCTFSATIITSATAENVNSTFNIVSGGIEYTVEFESTTLSEDQQHAIAQRLINNVENDIKSYGLMCTLFGHNTQHNTVGVITHKVKNTSPRCQRDAYYVTTCTRCDYQEQELTGTSYIICCPIE